MLNMSEKKQVTHDLAGRELRIEQGDLKTQADGYVTISLGDTVILATASMSDKGREGAEYFPLVVDYEENHYASGKIKGSRFMKRAGRPSDEAILNSRLIDRPIRPLFPKGTTNEVQIICTVLSADLEVHPGTTAITGASMALMLSGAPFEGPVAAVRIGMVDGELIVNPTYTQCEEGKLNLVVCGTADAITMVESESKEVSEEDILNALELAHKNIKELCALQEKLAAQFDIKKREADIVKPTEEDEKLVTDVISEDMMSLKMTSKKDFKEQVHVLEDKLVEKYAAQIEEGEVSERKLKEILNGKLEKKMRQNILDSDTRIDGRKLDEVRPLSCKVGVLPRTHGTGLFQRGETQVLTITTLGGPGAAQILETMDTDETKTYMHHYDFPPYSVGDIKMLRGASRREVGHGDLAERALEPMLPAKEKFAYTMWLVSKVLSCNGSSSMASVCGSTLSLMDAGVPIKSPISGIAMGLVTDGEKFKILSDIQGLEDFAGDMDFKVAGSKDGITALQMDIKVKGLSLDLLRDALAQAKIGRQTILDAMIAAIPEPRKEMSKHAPLIETVMINPDFIKVVIGKGGETIQKITAECEVEIDIEQDGLVTITAPDQEKGQKAKEWIDKLTYVPKVGDTFEGKVVRLMDFGAFVEITPGKDGLVHISQLAHERVNKVEDVVKMGDTLKVKLMEIDDQGRLNLSHKAVLPRPEGTRPPQAPPQQQ
jgi:polyribonucleotide nucleotidyltransferase